MAQKKKTTQKGKSSAKKTQTNKDTEKKIRYAVMGLGHIAQVAVLPAFKNAENSELVALISEDRTKLKKLGDKYKVDESCRYFNDEFPWCLHDADVDVLYLCTPNDLHTKYVMSALNEGVHVLCEKPLTITEGECYDMIDAAEENGCHLMTAYRLHFEEANLDAIKIAGSELGELRIFSSVFSMNVTDKDNIRLNETWRGGGPMWDIGIYCINAVRGIFRDEPIEVFAMAENNGDSRFSVTDEMITVNMRFPKNRLATFTCSFGADSCSKFDVVGTKGRLHLEKAYEYAADRELTVYKDDKKARTKKYKKSDQFAPEIQYFSECILKNRVPEPSAHEGLADVRIIQAILQSLDYGQAVLLDQDKEPSVRYPQFKQKMRKPPVRKPDTVHVTGPTN